MSVVRCVHLGALIALLWHTSGCAQLKQFESEIPDVRPLRHERAADVVASFERQRTEAEFQAARSFWKQGQRDQAITALTHLTRRCPEHVEGQRLLMELLLVSEQHERAVAVADGTSHLNDARTWHVRGLVYDAAGRRDDAWHCLEKAVQLEPRNVDFLASLKALDDSDLQGNHDAVLVSDQPPVAPATVKPRAKSVSPPRATRQVTSFTGMAPSCVLLTAEVCLELGRAEEARQRLELLADQPEYAAEVQGMLRAIASQGQSATTVAQNGARARAAEVHQPPQPRTLAKSATDESRALAGSAPAPLQASLIGNIVEASPVMVRTSAEVEAPAAINDPHIYLHQAGQALAANHVDTARAFLAKARELAPADESLALSLAVLPLRHEEYELAADLAQEGVRNFPQSAGLYRVLGTAQYRLGRWSAARDSLQRAISLDNRDGLAYFLMGCTLNKLGFGDEAQTYLRQAQQLDRRFSRETVLR